MSDAALELYLKLDDVTVGSDGQLSTPDSSGHGRDAVLTHCRLVYDDKFGKVLDFSGETLHCAPIPLGSFAQQGFTLSFWTNLEIQPDDLFVFEALLADGGEFVLDGPGTLEQWSHWALTYRGGQLTIFQNGTVVPTDIADEFSPAVVLTGIGAALPGARLAHFRVYSRLLNGDELYRARRTDELSVPPRLIDIDSDLAVHLPLDILLTPGPTTEDVVDKNRQVQISGSSPRLVYDEGFGLSLRLEADTSLQILENVDSGDGTDDQTLSAWFQTSAEFSGSLVIESGSHVVAVHPLDLHVDAYSAKAEIAGETWYHLASVQSDGDLLLYLNGSVLAHNPDPAWQNTDEGGTLFNVHIENGNTADTYAQLSAFRLYNRALSPAEVQAVARDDKARRRPGPGSNPLQLYYRLDQLKAETTELPDLSGHGRHGILVQGQIGLDDLNRTRLDGSRIHVPVSAFQSLDRAVTVEFWAQANAAGAEQTLFAGVSDDGNDTHPVLKFTAPTGSADEIQWTGGHTRIADMATAELAIGQESSGLQDGHHWALVRDVSNRRQAIYRDGELWLEKTNVDATYGIHGITAFTLGDQPDGGAPWSGGLAYFRVWSKAISQAEIQQHVQMEMARQSAPESADTEADLQLYLPLTDYETAVAGAVAAREVRDSSGKQHTVTVQGNPQASPDSQLGGAFGFEAADSLAVQDIPALSAFGLGFWLRFDPQNEGAGGQIISASAADGSGGGLRLERGQKGWTLTSDVAGISLNASDRIGDGHWHYVTLSADGEQGITLCVDGLVAQSGALPSGWQGMGGQAFAVGNGFTGQLSRLRLYSRVLDASDIQRLMDADRSPLGAFRFSHPIDFSFHNQDDEQTLYISEQSLGEMTSQEKDRHTYHLQLTNTSTKDILVKAFSAQELQQNGEGLGAGAIYHFQLRFRPSTLSENSLKLPASLSRATPTDGWNVYLGTEAGNLVEWLSLVYVGDNDLIWRAKTSEVFPGDGESPLLLSAAAAGGSRSTRLHLRYANLAYVADRSGGAAGPDVPAGTRSQLLNIINHSGKQYIPLHVGFVDSNTILNDGNTSNKLQLRITNTSLTESIPLKGASFRIGFDLPTDGQTDESWVLTSTTLAAAIQVSLEGATVAQEKPQTQSSEAWEAAYTDDGPYPLWCFTGKKEGEALAAGKSITLSLANIQCDTPTGYTHLYLHYSVTGYWEGRFVCPIQKGPLVYRGQNVGIGTDDPQAMLHVKGDTRIEGNLRIGGDGDKAKENSGKLHIETNSGGSFSVPAWGAGGGQEIVGVWKGGKYKENDEEKQAGGQIRFNGIEPHFIDLGQNGVGDFVIRTDDKDRLLITQSGNVGIGTNSPQATLHVKGDTRIEGNLQIGGDGDGGITVRHVVGKSHNSSAFDVLQLNYASGYNVEIGSLNKNAGLIVRGKVGIGVEEPESALHVDGRIRIESGSAPEEEIFFADNGQIRSSDDNHRILFRRSENKMEFREYGEIIFSSGATDGNETPRMVVAADGKVGIGTSSPTAPLHVAGTGQQSRILGAYWVRKNGNNTHTDINSSPSIIADSDILTKNNLFGMSFYATSDVRTKTIVGRSNAEEDLKTIKALEVTDYTYRDARAGTQMQKQLVGQQVKQVFPQATSTRIEVVPDIMREAEQCDYNPETKHVTITLPDPHDLKVGEVVEIYAGDDRGRITIEELPDKKSFCGRSEKEIEWGSIFDRVFVYGRLVPDFHSVNYNAVSMLHLSATQELNRRVESLQDKNEELTAMCERLTAQLAKLVASHETGVS